MKVTRGGRTLPISQVPNLKAGDRIWLHPNFPESQTARYLMIPTFLQGSTNPPPEKWFTRAETWNGKIREEGIYVNVPPSAEQTLLFLAPETGGDFTTLRSNVRSKPGVFVRASQDLNQASLDRARSTAYITAITRISETEPANLQEKSRLLARSLDIKVDDACFKKPEAQQLACLTQSDSVVVLDDGHTQSTVAALTSGASADLIGQLSSSPMAGAGVYSPYVGAIVDVVRIMDGIHTAQYQYIPALGQTEGEELNLKLNSPPSFTNPKSVLTVGLPAVAPVQVPPLRAIDPDRIYCATARSFVLPVDNAPLVYATALGHDYGLRILRTKGDPLDLPAHPVAESGGFLVEISPTEIASLDPEMVGVLHGYWGFEPFDGPSFHLATARAGTWSPLGGADPESLVVGREDTLLLQAHSAACVDDVSVEEPDGRILKASYKLIKDDELQVQLPLQDAAPGRITVMLRQAGLPSPDQVHVQAYPEAAHLRSFTIHAGDQTGILEGSQLDEVSKFSILGVAFVPQELSRKQGGEELVLKASGSAAALEAGQTVTAKVVLKDGRKLDLVTTIERARPKVTLVGKSFQLGPSAGPTPIHLSNQDELPQDSILTFVLRAEVPAEWSRTQKLEVGAADGEFGVSLSVEDGSLTLQDESTVLATLNPLKSFGPSAFGALRFRAVGDDGAVGDWQPLGALVRIPTLKEVRCPPVPDRPCSLIGTDLFLLESVAATSSFRNPVEVPLGFAAPALEIPRPDGTLLFLRLRDDPKATNLVSLPVLPE